MNATSTTQPGLLTGEGILAADDHRLERVDVPEWGGHVYIRTMGGDERDLFEQSFLDERGKRKRVVANIRAGLLARTLCDQAGARLFNDKQVAQLGRKNGVVLERLFLVAQRVNGLSDEDIEEIAGNLQADQRDDSITT